MVSNQATTDRSGGREVGGQIIQNGDRWSVAKWPPTDQFSDSRLEAEREKRIKKNTDQSSGVLSSGSRVTRS